MTKFLPLALIVAILTTASFAMAGTEPWFHSDGEFSHRAQVDPIVNPGTQSAHMHDFFCNTSTDANSTPQSLGFHPATTCVRDDEQPIRPGVPNSNSAAYWVMTFIDNDQFVTASDVTVGYGVQVGLPFEEIVPFPAEHVMVTPNAPQGGFGLGTVWRYRCPAGIAQAGTATTPPRCVNNDLRFDLNFPECGNGQNDSPDHRSHMAYPVKINGVAQCPASHPILHPRVRLLLKIPSDGGPDFRLSSGTIETSHGDRMSSTHWQPKQEQLVEDCLSAGRYCGGTSAPVEF